MTDDGRVLTEPTSARERLVELLRKQRPTMPNGPVFQDVHQIVEACAEVFEDPNQEDPAGAVRSCLREAEGK